MLNFRKLNMFSDGLTEIVKKKVSTNARGASFYDVDFVFLYLVP